VKEILLNGQWHIDASVEEVFKVVTDFEKFPVYFPKVAESIMISKKEENYLEIDAVARSFGRKLPVKMKTQILPGRGFISDNESPTFGTSGHEEFLLSSEKNGTRIDYTYKVSLYKRWLRLLAVPLIRWYSMRYWERAVINELRNILRK